jgi:DNA-binding protein H-NS
MKSQQTTDWRSQLAASQSTYEELFPELNEHGQIFSYKTSSSPKQKSQQVEKQNKYSPYQKLFEEHNFNPLESHEYLPSGKHISDPQR